MIVTGDLPRGKSIDVGDFADLTLTPVESIRWGPTGDIVVTFAADLDAATALAVQRRIGSRNAAEETLRGRAEQALTGNRTYLAIPPAPTAAQSQTQVEALTRQVQGLIRIVLDRLDGTD
jgi:Lon protease-like protein